MSTEANTEMQTMPGKELATLAPRTLAEAMEFSKLVSQSAIVPKDYQGKPANVLVAVQWGMELGLAPMQAMQNIAVINGRPSVWGDAMLAICQGHPQFAGIEETVSDDGATCTVHRKGRNPVTQTFTMADAKRAGLAGKQGPWTQYPRRMMQMRARAFALRDAFADALKGIQMAEEVADIPLERDMGQAQVVDKPAPSRSESIKQRVRKKREPDPETVDVETGEVIEVAPPSPPTWSFEDLMRDLGNCQDAEAFGMLRDAARSIYLDLDPEQQRQLSDAIASVEQELEGAECSS